jgi:hypothetical protein
MSWSTSTDPVAKDAIDPPAPVVGDYIKAEQAEQFEAAKKAAAALAEAVGRPDDEVQVTMVGHANPEHAPQQGWSPEAITVTVVAKPRQD